ncbi:60S ribosomal protein L8 [Homalodisca vitripennis]|nr:60S ribosomal protein L8 [Homalodisca vitripennis]
MAWRSPVSPAISIPSLRIRLLYMIDQVFNCAHLKKNGNILNETSYIGKASTVKRGTSAGRKVGLIAARSTGRIREGKKDNPKGDD